MCEKLHIANGTLGINHASQLPETYKINSITITYSERIGQFVALKHSAVLPFDRIEVIAQRLVQVGAHCGGDESDTSLNVRVVTWGEKHNRVNCHFRK